MRWRTEEPPATTHETFESMTIDSLKPLARLLTAGELPKRKGELVALAAGAMQQPKQVRELYNALEPLGQAAVQEAAHDPKGRFHADRFEAKYGRLPDFDESSPDDSESYYSYRRATPKPLSLFFPKNDVLPTDLRAMLLEFVPEPRPVALPTLDALPATFRLTWEEWDGKVKEGEDVPLRVRETAREALHDVKAVLRLVEAARVRVSDKKRQPTAVARQEVAAVLLNGDFYTAEEQAEYKDDAAYDLAIKAFAWPMIVQAAGLALPKGERLELTPAGRKALSQPAPDVIRAAWKKWRTSTLLDEFNRVEAIKGQGKGRLSALPARRKVVLDGLAQWPAGRWFSLDDFSRFLRTADRDFVVAHDAYQLYIAEHHYGNLGYEGRHLWELLQGRYILALLFEYAAAMGLLDAAYLPPQGVRPDYGDRWGTDDLSCLSRYDGLLYARINPLGAWCLGLAEKYEPPILPRADVLQVLPNLDVVAKLQPLDAADRLLLDRFADRQSEAVWRLNPTRILEVVEKGGSLDELEEFLSARSDAPLPQTVRVFLDDLRRRGGRLRDLGTARLIECVDPELARMLAGDPMLRNRCELAGDRRLVFRAEDETAVRKALHRLGLVLPPQG